MLSYDDCIALAALTEDEIAAVAEHEHLTQMAALEMGDYLTHDAAGCLRIKAMIVEDIAAARTRHDLVHAAKLRLVLSHFVRTHIDKAADAQADTP